ncbi:MAG: 16S rRNA (cytosine(1402)-N(4))-methyltransferase RsmH [Planctomycetes bacterium]|nr:16S rRNA (cytosine(1402)-N(4))-methyltransferase RsmH [Planctomycetota bacterium]
MSNKGNKTPSKIRARGKTVQGTHVPVLVKEILKALDPSGGQTVADCTMGFGGHAEKFIQRIGETGKYVGMEIDGKHFECTSKKLLALKAETIFLRKNFSAIAAVKAESAPNGFDIIFADLGISSMQVDDSARGISYKSDGPLDMRMDDRLEKTGADLLAELSEQRLSEILWKYSDEPDHKLIAQWIAGQRLSSPITTVNQLVRLVINAKGLTEKTWKKKNKNLPFGSAHPAARTFQAIRIAVNGEIDALEKLLTDGPNCLSPGSVIGIMSFQSGEDKLVKQAFKAGLEDGIYQEISQKPITPAKWEIIKNPRSSSAKFRWAKRT